MAAFDLRTATQIQRVLLTNVRLTGRSFGSYRSAVEMEMGGTAMTCVGKQIRDTSLAIFLEECGTLFDLRHPHIVQYLGVCVSDSGSAHVVMEYLPHSLDHVLKSTARLSLAAKRSILCDVAWGMEYLHCRPSPIVHGKLTAPNVLLTSGMVAKISDVGVCMHSSDPTSMIPGTLACLPPEAQGVTPTYTVAVDVFSFGQLSLYTLVQEFPNPSAATYVDPNILGVVMARTEYQRRAHYIHKLPGMLVGTREAVVRLIERCLENDPGQRPWTQQIVRQLNEEWVVPNDPYMEMTKLELVVGIRTMQVGEVSNAREDVHRDDLSTGTRGENSDEAETSQTEQVVKGSGRDSGQKPDIDVSSTDSDGPVETLELEGCNVGEDFDVDGAPTEPCELECYDTEQDLDVDGISTASVETQEMDGCDAGEELNLDDIPSDSDEMFETQEMDGCDTGADRDMDGIPIDSDKTQEMEGCDIGEDPDIDGVPTDSDKTVETETSVGEDPPNDASIVRRSSRRIDALSRQSVSTQHNTSPKAKKKQSKTGGMSNTSSTQSMSGCSSIKPFSCTHCEPRLARSAGRPHSRVHTSEKPFPCTYCEATFSQSTNLKSHLRTQTGEKPFSCTYCEATFSRSTNLNLHLRTHTGEKPFFCTYCEAKFSQSSHLKGHLRTHTGEKPFSCTYCEAKFSQSAHLKSHLRTHTGEKPFSCTYCEAKFSRSATLKLHLHAHTGEKPFSCTYCEAKFSQSIDLKRHLRTHTGEKPFSCTYCEAKFSRSTTLKLHLRAHTGEKPFSCTYCEAKFSQSIVLKRHLRTHTGEKPFSCTYCEAKFSQSAHLKSHLRTHTGEKPFSCTYCEATFSQSSNLKLHLRTHTGEKPFSCTYCEAKFSQTAHLKRHLSKHS